MTTVELTENDAQTFVRFQKHRALVELLEAIGAFDVKSGSVTIHFSALGGIVSVSKEEHFKPIKVVSYPQL